MAATVDPVFEALPEFYTEQMILDLIVSKNIERRQLKPGQRAAMALEYERFYADAAKVTGASGRGVQQAKAVQRDAPDLYDKVRTGTTSLDAAYKQARQRARDEPKPEPVKRSSTMLTLKTHVGTDVLYPQPQASAKFNETKGDGISWAKWSWNPVTGCLHGCSYCYARELATKESYKSAYPAKGLSVS